MCPSFRQNVESDQKLSTLAKFDQHLTHCGQIENDLLSFFCAQTRGLCLTRFHKVSQTTNLTARRQTSNVRLYPQPRAPVLREAGVSTARGWRIPLASELLPAVVVEVQHVGIAAGPALVPGAAVAAEEHHTFAFFLPDFSFLHSRRMPL